MGGSRIIPLCLPATGIRRGAIARYTFDPGRDGFAAQEITGFRGRQPEWDLLAGMRPRLLVRRSGILEGLEDRGVDAELAQEPRVAQNQAMALDGADDALAGGVALIGELDTAPDLLATTDRTIADVANGAVRYAGSVGKLLG